MAELLGQDDIDELLSQFNDNEDDVDSSFVSEGRKCQEVRTHFLYDDIDVIDIKRCKTRQKHKDEEYRITKLYYLSNGKIIVDRFPAEVFDTTVYQLKKNVKIICTFYMDFVGKHTNFYGNN